MLGPDRACNRRTTCKHPTEQVQVGVNNSRMADNFLIRVLERANGMQDDDH